MSASAHRRSQRQRGALMVALMAGIAIMMILSAVATQKWSDVIRRDDEAEMIFRAEDIVRALKRFQKDKAKLPNELKELTEPGQRGQYFIRKLWKDPLVKGGQWQLLYAAPGGGLYDPTVATGDNPPQLGLSSPGPSASAPTGIPDLIQKSDSGGEGSGLPIAGVKTKCKDPPFRLYRDKSEYNEWVFSVFDAPNAAAGAAPVPGVPAPGSPGQPRLQNPGDGPPKASFPPR